MITVFSQRRITVMMITCIVAFTCLTLAGTYHTPATAAKAPKAKTPLVPQATFVGSETCGQCHEDAPKELAKHFHGQAMRARETKKHGYLCEGCHGAGSLHANEPSTETAAPLRLNALNGTGCLSCHNTRLSSAKWQRSEHHRGKIACLSCHGTMANPTKEQPGKLEYRNMVLHQHGDIVRKPATDICLACHAEKRGEITLPSHHPINEKQIGCADCHNPHAPLNNAMKRDVCVTCHVAQRGPFVYSHGAITGELTDACLDCHRPHGSPNQHLLKLSSRGLCLQCHADRVNHNPGRQCWDCHTALHGSNTSPTLLR